MSNFGVDRKLWKGFKDRCDDICAMSKINDFTSRGLDGGEGAEMSQKKSSRGEVGKEVLERTK